MAERGLLDPETWCIAHVACPHDTSLSPDVHIHPTPTPHHAPPLRNSHRKKRVKQIRRMAERGLLDPEKEDPFQLFVSSTQIRQGCRAGAPGPGVGGRGWGVGRGGRWE
jgi:hypothetical protein